MRRARTRTRSGLGTLRQPEALRGWLATIAVRVTRRRLRRHRFYRFIGLAPADEYDRIADPAASPFDRALMRAVYRALEEVGIDERSSEVRGHRVLRGWAGSMLVTRIDAGAGALAAAAALEAGFASAGAEGLSGSDSALVVRGSWLSLSLSLGIRL